jgi:hypothetical protein
MIAALALLSAFTLSAPPASSPDTVATALPAPTTSAAGLFAPTGSSVALLTPSSSAAEAGARRGMGDGRQEKQEMVEYSDAYFTRLTIHKWASYLTVPLFVGEYVVGQKLINGEGSDRLRGVHGALAGGIAGLFVVNTVTGGLNAIEARKDPEERNRRTLHSVLMLLADAGFVATGMLAKENEDEGGWSGGPANNNTHRNVALASMGTALVSYAIMLPIFRRD